MDRKLMRTTAKLALAAFSALTVLASAAAAIDSLLTDDRKVTELAPGVYEIRHKDPFPGWVNGNATVIIGGRDVLVVDSCQFSYSAQEDIAQIRHWTSKPVRYVVNTHWHQDHNGGNPDYMDAFPGVAIIAHPMTREMIANTSPNVPKDTLAQAEPLRERLTKRLETGKEDDGRPLTDERRAISKKRLDQIEQIITALKSYRYQLPTLVFDRELSIDLGGREVQVKHLGRGNTAGDVVIYLPKEKILMTGDLVVSPVPFAFDGYPTEWIDTLERVLQIDADIIAPGHGDPMHDKTYVRQWLDTMKSLVAQVEAQLRKNNSASLEDVKKAIDIAPFRETFCGAEKNCAQTFDVSVGDKFIELAYHQAKQR